MEQFNENLISFYKYKKKISRKFPAERSKYYNQFSARKKDMYPGAGGDDSVIIAYDCLMDSDGSWDKIVFYSMLHVGDSDTTGMIGGYYKWEEEEVFDSVEILRKYNVMPALSCGFQPGLTEWVTNKVGVDYMANVGGAIHGHPGGTIAGAKAMRQSIDGTGGHEFDQAIDKWGKK